MREISGSHGRKSEDDSLLGYSTMVTLKQINVSEVCTASIIRAMMTEEVCTSETSVYFETTQWCIPDGCYSHCCENLKSHIVN
jgi:hypothetical protein